MSFPAYDEYKDSGVEWLGDVPDYWEVRGLKFLSDIQTGDKDTVDAEVEGEFPFFVRSQTIERISTKSFDCEAILTAGDGVGVGKVFHYHNGPFDFHQRVYMMNNFRDVDGRFLFHYLKSNFYKVALEGGAKSTVDSIRRPMLSDFPVSFPPCEAEQKAISSFLDVETSKIDGLVSEQRRLIELLKEKRQAVISHAVTKGLNPNAPMKPSGIQWLGDVPEHWGCTALIRIAKRVVVGIAEAATHAYADEGIPILRSTNIRAREIRGEMLYVDPSFADERDSKRIYAGDLVTVRTGNAGVTAEIPKELDGCQCFTMLITTLNDEHNPAFFTYWMNSVNAQCYFTLQGWGTAQVNNSVPILKALPVPIPPSAEQVEIVEFLNSRIGQFDTLQAEAERAIELLQERRTALISAAVTGKINVRESAYQETA